MESYLNENFGDVKPKNSSDEALQRWRKLCWIVKNPKRRFRFTANLSKRSEAEAIRRSNQEKFRVAVLVSQAALQFINSENRLLPCVIQYVFDFLNEKVLRAYRFKVVQ
jgi:Ca2+-transporting ATPase